MTRIGRLSLHQKGKYCICIVLPLLYYWSLLLQYFFFLENTVWGLVQLMTFILNVLLMGSTLFCSISSPRGFMFCWRWVCCSSSVLLQFLFWKMRQILRFADIQHENRRRRVLFFSWKDMLLGFKGTRFPLISRPSLALPTSRSFSFR